ncbi:Signal transduction histidine kinase [Tenacibaculum mesophilum]|uniref:histidine kinase n=1 Tax=Tenacibaculum mesophilum TaxID=104268 RepID=A0ABN5T8H9_9FLAO|nr:ATP-binding protein [Tenacibaculum mesophilum]AZJ32639.1 response regulator [Tenacibaculum mesophilum]QFS27890.1 response regulator [Tenacibaculum mesophilum]SHG06610.1 Signal transduction histidine kinase [Tenacibaculum mesophilum]
MKESKRKIAFKVLVGYATLAVLAVISGILLFSEIKTYIEIQKQGVSDRNNIIQTGGLIADIYENENLGRAAIQLNSYKRYNEYVTENKLLLKKIDSLNFIAKDVSKTFILDSVKLVLNKKRKNITSLRRLNQRNASEKSIDEAIDKLGSIDSLLGKGSVKDLVDNPDVFNKKTGLSLEKYLRLFDNEEEGEEKPVNVEEQKKIDSLVSASKEILQKAQRETVIKRRFLRIKERELIENDIIISRKLREVLNVLEKDVIVNANIAHKKHEETLERSRNIILLAAGVGFVIIILFSIIILNDFWRSQHYRQELESANAVTSSLLKSREQLISMVSHDLRTPLSTITGFSELLQKSITSTKEKNYVVHIQNASVYMGQLVGDLLEFSKLENSKITIETIPFDLKRNIEEVANSAKSLVQNKPISINVNHDENINSLIVSDPFRIKQILYNLVTNACKFTKEGSITIKSKLRSVKEKKYIEIRVIDTGVGIGKDEQEKVFKEFTQAHEKENRQNGFGLGLTISRRLAELLGGSLTLQSSLGKGSIFSLFVPITFAEEKLNIKEISSQNKSLNINAIIVEDDASLRILLKNVLEELGIVVTSFSNAQEALSRIDNIIYDLVLTDIQLPKMNGIHFMETLKKHKSYKGQPIIAMTGRANLSENEYVKNGFSDAIIKPFHAKKLEEILQRFFDFKAQEKDVVISKIDNEITTNSFDITSLKTFLNNDEVEIKKILKSFLKDTEDNLLLLKELIDNNDAKGVNDVSHKMLGMFRQLKATRLITFLEEFEVSKEINKTSWKDFEKELEIFLVEIKKYLN